MGKTHTDDVMCGKCKISRIQTVVSVLDGEIIKKAQGVDVSFRWGLVIICTACHNISLGWVDKETVKQAFIKPEEW